MSKKIKKVLSLFMAMTLILGVSVIGSVAEQKASPLFTITDVDSRQGEEFDVTIKFAQDIKPERINIAALDVSLKYDFDAFEVVKVIKGGGLNSAFDLLAENKRLHLENGDYVFNSGYKIPGSVNWCMSTIDGFTFKKNTDFAIVTFKAKNFADTDKKLNMTLEVTNAADKSFNNITSQFSAVENNVKIDVNLATLCSWEYDNKTQTYTLKKLNDKNATYFTIPDEYEDTSLKTGLKPVAGIADSAFTTSSLIERLVIGENVKSVGFAAFYGCKALKKITVYSDDAVFSPNTFFGADTSGLVIRCRKDSTADKFARANGISVENFQDIGSCVFTGTEEEKYYTGTPLILSDLQIHNSYGAKLSEGKDYDIEYENNVEIGQAVIHVYGKGEYWGTTDINFDILCPYHTEDSEYFTVQEVYGNCEEGGKVVKTCSFCKYIDESETLPPKAHSDFEWKVLREATCSEEGLKVFGCPDCSYYDEAQTEVIEKTDHDKQWVTIQDPTCKDKGIKELQCIMCHESFEQGEIDCVDHECQWVETKPATCMEDGEESYICQWCGNSFDTRPIKCPGNHVAYDTDWVTVTEPTCKKDGKKKLLCRSCGELIDEDIIPKSEHTAQLEVITTDPTCTEPGEIKTICTSCGETVKTEVINPTGHKKATEWGVIKPATCTEPGLEGIACEYCGEVYESKEIPQLEHERTDDYVVIKEPTCTESGKEAIICKHCGEEKIFEERDIDALGHKYETVVTKEPTCTEGGESESKCIRCGKVRYTTPLDPKGHSYGEWEVRYAPTCTSDGYEMRTCASCGDVELRVAKATGHNPIWVYKVRPSYKLTGIEKMVCEHCGMEYGKTRVCDKIVPDVDGNGKVSSADALMILQQSTELIQLTGEPLKKADCNGDGKVNSTDALLVLQLATGLIKA